LSAIVELARSRIPPTAEGLNWKTMSGSYVIWLELEEARSKLLEIKWLRVTTDAIQGSPTTVPIAPERLRQHSLKAYPDGTVDHDPQTTDRWREIVVHPGDWLSMRAEASSDGMADPFNRLSAGTTMFDLPVI
jgi:hypothetical protein